MVGTSNFYFQLAGRFRRSKPVYPVWSVSPETSRVRHPSRPKYTYRARGRSGATPDRLRLLQSTQDNGAVWAARTRTAKSSQQRRSVAKISATIASLGIVMGGYALTQTNAPPVQSAKFLTPFQQSPTLNPGPFADTLQLSPPANLASPPVVSAAPPYLVTGTASQNRPRLRRLPIQPRISDIAPALGQSPRPSTRPEIVATASEAPDMTRPLQLVQPVAAAPFVCGGCESSAPVFEGVTFAVQSADPASAATRRLISALAAYHVDLRGSDIAYSQSEVRFYRPQDAEAARYLAGQYNAQSVDLTWITSAADTPRIDIILAGSTN